MDNVPMDGTQTNKAPVADEVPAAEVKTEEVLAAEVPAEEISADEVPAEKTPVAAEEAPADEALVGGIPVGGAPPKAPIGQKKRNRGLAVAIGILVTLLACFSVLCVYAFINGAESLPFIGRYFSSGNTDDSGAAAITVADATARIPAAETTTVVTEEAPASLAPASLAPAGLAGALAPVAMLGDIPIQQYEFTYFINFVLNYYDVSDIGTAKQNALQMVTEFKILNTKARELGVEFTDEDRRTLQNVQYETLPDYAKMAGISEEDYVNMYFGVSLAKYISIVENMILNDRLTETLVEATEVSDEETLAKYRADPSAYNSVTVSHILFYYEGADPENPRSSKESEELTELTLQRVQAGEDFAELVAELTEDAASVDTGGEYTFTRNDDYVSEFMDWAFASEAGDTGIVETDYGYHVIRLDSVQDTFDDFKDAIANELKYESVAAQYSAWYNEPRFASVINQDLLDSLTTDAVFDLDN